MQRALPLLLSCLSATIGCSGDTTIMLTADKTTITAGGIDFATITIKATLTGDPAAQGTTINVSTTAGSFSPDEELTQTTLAADGNGAAVLKLYSGASRGAATVTADFYDDTTGLTASGSLTITFGAPTDDQLPVDGSFRLVCDAVNIGALREPVPDIKVSCSLTAQTRNGTAIPAAALEPELRAEAGSLKSEKDSYSGERVLVYSPKGGQSAPRDVPPDMATGEPSYADPNGRQRNPRDGLVTMIAVIDGEEAFTDANGNGQYDAGEPFVDAAEPFVDTNDDDLWNPDEAFIDANGNGQWDQANGAWDARTKITAIYKILWTGPLDSSNKTSRIDRPTSSINDGGKLELTAHLLDANLNPIAAFAGNSDYLEWVLTSGGDAASSDPTTPPLKNSLGFSFDKAANNERQRWLILSNSYSPKPFRFTIEDGYPKDGDNAPTPFTVTVTAYATPGPQGGDYYLDQLTESLDDRVQGTCN